MPFRAVLDVFYQYTHSLCFICLTLVFSFPVAIHCGILTARSPRDVLGSLDWYLHILGFCSLSLKSMSSTTRISQYTLFIGLYIVTRILSITYSVHH